MQIIQEEQNHDEVQHFLNTRYVSSMEATWRILTLTCVVENEVANPWEMIYYLLVSKVCK